jgi:ABC-type multidrug transport system ATPase subunit
MEGLLQQAGEMTILVSSHELGEIDGVADIEIEMVGSGGEAV